MPKALENEEKIRVGKYRAYSQVGRQTSETKRVERNVVGGWRPSAAVASAYSITINPDVLPLNRDDVAHALHNALHISTPDAEDLLKGRVAVLMELDGRNHHLVIELLRALRLSFAVATV